MNGAEYVYSVYIVFLYVCVHTPSTVHMDTRMYSRTCLVRTSKGRQNQYFLSEVLTIRTDVCTVCTVCIGGTECGALAIQECVLNQVLNIRVGLCT